MIINLVRKTKTDYEGGESDQEKSKNAIKDILFKGVKTTSSYHSIYTLRRIIMMWLLFMC